MKSFIQYLRESIIDIPRKHYSKTIFDNFNTSDPVLKPSVVAFIENGMKVFEKFAPIKKHCLIGSILTKQYRKDADLDVNLFFDIPPKNRESITIEMRRLVSKSNGKTIPGTAHPVNYYVITDKQTYYRANEMADNVYDIANASFIKRSAEQEFSVDEYMKHFKQKVEKMDILKGELDRDIIDYKELDELDRDDIDNLNGMVKKKLAELEKDMKVLISMGHGIWKERQGEFKREMTPKEIVKFGTHNGLPKNVIYKMLEKYHYVKLWHDLEDILGDDEKLSSAEADKLLRDIPR
jgi:hypothetical protein